MQRSTIGSLLRSTQAYCSQICDKETLRYGIAYYSERFGLLPEANQFREVFLEDPVRMGEAYEQTHEWFVEHGVECSRWAPAEGQPADRLADFLGGNGFQPRAITAMTLTQWVKFAPLAQVRIMPARAMRAVYRAMLLADDPAESPDHRAMRADAQDERLNDPQLDMFVALVGSEPAGHGGLYQIGDFARLMDFAVLPAFHDAGVDRALLAHLLAMAKRLTMRSVHAQVDALNDDRRSFLRSAGFVEDGEIVEFHRDATMDIGDVR